MEGAEHVVVSVSKDSLRVQQGKKKVSRPSSRYGGHVVVTLPTVGSGSRLCGSNQRLFLLHVWRQGS